MNRDFYRTKIGLFSPFDIDDEGEEPRTGGGRTRTPIYDSDNPSVEPPVPTVKPLPIPASTSPVPVATKTSDSPTQNPSIQQPVVSTQGTIQVADLSDNLMSFLQSNPLIAMGGIAVIAWLAFRK